MQLPSDSCRAQQRSDKHEEPLFGLGLGLGLGRGPFVHPSMTRQACLMIEGQYVSVSSHQEIPRQDHGS